jgi:DNA helicase II / ATP-dependent DNA helicase PcrA
VGTVDFTALKLKLISSIVAISGISLLRSFLKIGDGLDEADLKWRVIIHLTFVVPYLVSAEDETAQASYVADHVLEQREAGIALKRQAVLFRAAHHSDLLEIELGRRNIPFVKYGGLKFLEAAHVKDVLAILRWAENPRDAVAGFRALQLQPGIGPAIARSVLDRLSQEGFAATALTRFAPPPAAFVPWPGFCRMIERLRA